MNNVILLCVELIRIIKKYILLYFYTCVYNRHPLNLTPQTTDRGSLTIRRTAWNASNSEVRAKQGAVLHTTMWNIRSITMEEAKVKTLKVAMVLIKTKKLTLLATHNTMVMKKMDMKSIEVKKSTKNQFMILVKIIFMTIMTIMIIIDRLTRSLQSATNLPMKILVVLFFKC